MLQLTPDTLNYLRGAIVQRDEKMPRQRIADAKPKLRPISKSRFDHLVNSTAAILATGIPTKFLYEGACRHGLRSSLCLQGWNWSDADATAAGTVAAALRGMGAERPSWSEGQPEWTQPGYAPVKRFTCARCGGRLPEVPEHARELIYCSAICRYGAALDRRRQLRKLLDEAEYQAALAANKELRRHKWDNALTRVCETCETVFRADRPERRFCSYACRGAAQRVNGEAKRAPVCADRPCNFCGKLFRTDRPEKKFCSTRCCKDAFAAKRKATVQPKRCQTCGTDFQSHRSGARFCSRRCGGGYRKAGEFLCEAAE